jgi:hypothetical protein
MISESKALAGLQIGLNKKPGTLRAELISPKSIQHS